MPIKRGVQESWSFEIDNGRLKVSGTGSDAESCDVEAYRPGVGYGPSETPEVRVSVKISAADWHELAALVGARLASTARGGR